jgi:hypothetical protein
MPVTTSDTATNILNRVAVEVGLNPVTDPYASPDENFIQLAFLLNSAGEDLAIIHDWGFLVKEAAIDTDLDPSGEYPLPDDFLYITNQTCWERNNRVPVQLLTAQEWQYLEGRQFATDTIYAKFRLQMGKFTIYPQPVPSGLNIHYEYTSKNWVADGTNPGTFKDVVTTGLDRPLYDRTLMIKALKVKWLEAKGFDSSKAQDDLNATYTKLTAHDKGAPTLNAGYGTRGYPYLDIYRNTPDTNFGNP